MGSLAPLPTTTCVESLQGDVETKLQSHRVICAKALESEHQVASWGSPRDNIASERGVELKIPQVHGIGVASNRQVRVMSTRNLLPTTRTNLTTQARQSRLEFWN